MPWISALSAALATIAPLVAAQTPEDADYDPVKGFKPAQTNLTKIFLQIAGSLEFHGSPAPYLRHIQAEEKRIAAKYKANTGGQLKNHRPDYMTDEYINQLIENWDVLSLKLGLDKLARTASICTRTGINGSRGRGTIVIDAFNDHQNAIVAGMEGRAAKPGFEKLQARLSAELGFNGPPAAPDFAVIVEKETALTDSERKQYASFLRLKRFTKAEFGLLERFYTTAFDKLTEAGKDEMSRRVWAGTRPAEPAHDRLDAINAAQQFRSELKKITDRIDAALPPERAAPIKKSVERGFLDLGQMAQTELELGLLESVAR